MSDYGDYLDVGRGRVIDTSTRDFWNDPEALRLAGAEYKRRAAQPLPHWPKSDDPEPEERPPSFMNLMHRRVDDPPFDAAAFRTACAMGEIRKALAEEERQAAAQAQKDLATKRQAVKQAAGDVGRLMMMRRI